MTAVPKPAAMLVVLLLAACATVPMPPPNDGHLRIDDVPIAAGNIPSPVRNTLALPAPKTTAGGETYSVVVNNVRVQDLLFALARDARINVDIHPGIQGVVHLNAIDQTLQQILTRIARQVDMRWELDGSNLAVMPDTPFLRTYTVDYVNMSRDASGSISISTQIASATPTAGGSQPATSASAGGNISNTKVDNLARNHFWESLEKNVKDILRETDKIMPEGSSETVVEHSDSQATTGTGVAGRTGGAPSIAASPNPAALQQQGTTVVRRATFREAASVIVNAESGIVVVRATLRQHEKVREFLDHVTASVRRQVLIEATIAEVRLSHEYRQGIAWQSLRSQRSGGPNSAGFQMSQKPTGTVNGRVPDPLTGAATAGAAFLLDYVAPGLGISATISLLENFGNVRVLSSPKIGVLNNQTALLKVVNNTIYFDIKADTATSSTGLATTTVTTTPRSVSVGLVMTVTPQISDSGVILLNVRPSISRISGIKNDPNPNIPAGLVNSVPEIETREMESVLRLNNGEVAVMGGLMQDAIDHTTNAVPGLADLPLIGHFFKQRDETSSKTELVVFLRPLVIRDPSVRGDFLAFRERLPGSKFFDAGQDAAPAGMALP